MVAVVMVPVPLHGVAGAAYCELVSRTGLSPAPIAARTAKHARNSAVRKLDECYVSVADTDGHILSEVGVTTSALLALGCIMLFHNPSAKSSWPFLFG